MKTKLWQTDDQNLHPQIEKYTVGNDYFYDQQLLGYDIQATKAHVLMLASIGILKKAEAKTLVSELKILEKKWSTGKFEILPAMEDGHTAIELYLTRKLGSLGKKVHAGRSRNDQSLVMLRLYLKDSLQKLSLELAQVSQVFNQAAIKAGQQAMPGYTHGQKAMPTTVATWLESFAEGFKDFAKLVEVTLQIIDQNPLGSAAGFGSSLPLDKQHTTKSLGFKKIQDNPMYCGLSRGLFELIALQALAPAMVLAGKFAADMQLFTSPEFGFFSLPKNMTTGSSIMPQKQNYDVFEIMKGKSLVYSGYINQLHALSAGSTSGYGRELQLTKPITLEAMETVEQTLAILKLVVPKIKMNPKSLNAAMTDELYAVEEINALLAKGMTFRDAYQKVKQTYWNS